MGCGGCRRKKRNVEGENAKPFSNEAKLEITHPNREKREGETKRPFALLNMDNLQARLDMRQHPHFRIMSKNATEENAPQNGIEPCTDCE